MVAPRASFRLRKGKAIMLADGLLLEAEVRDFAWLWNEALEDSGGKR